MTRIVIDPGHGGTSDHGKSTAFGARGRGGTLEKHVTLEVARQVAARLGGTAVLTRTTDRNLSLKERAAHAAGADVFVSLHANEGGAERAGPETWVHPAAGGGSRALAATVQQALLGGRFGGPEPMAAELALINPAIIGARCDACLVELDYLSDPRGEDRLRDPGHRAALGAAIAGAIRQHLGRGRALGDGQSFDVRYEVPLIPQPTGMSCWAASAAMLVSWREQMSRVDAAEIARGAGQWAAYQHGLNPARVGDLASAWGLTSEAPASYTIDALREMLERKGPLWIGEAVPSLHAVVLAGLFGDGTPDGTSVLIVDPWPVGTGATYTWPFMRWVRAYEAAASVPSVNIQILHNGGAGPVFRLGRRFGDGAVDDPGIEGPIPDDAVAEAEGLARGLQAPSPEYPAARRYVEARAGHFRVPATARTIDRIVIHITDGTSTNGTISWFRSAQNTGRTSAHYVVGQDGEVVQMVRHANIAHHATTANARSIGIEHVALSPAGARALSARTGRTINPLPPTEAEYRASARLVAWLCCELGIPVDREHILGHSEAATTSHSDCPNSVWDWTAYMGYVREYYQCPPVGDFPTPPSDRAYAGRRLGTRPTPDPFIIPDPSSYTGAGLVEVVRVWADWTSRYVRWRLGVPHAAYTRFPHSAICELEVSGPGGSGFGTGFYIGPNKILTCGHNFKQGSWAATSVTVRPGKSPVQSIWPERTFTIAGGSLVHPRWLASEDNDWDMAVLNVPGLAAPNGAYFDLPNQTPAGDQQIVVCGYGKFQGDTTPDAEEGQYADGATLTSATSDLYYFPIQAIPGHSGSPVFWGDRVIAILTGPRLFGTTGMSDYENRGVRITPDKIDWINTR